MGARGEYYVRTERMSVGYDGVPLLKEISIGVRRGEILALIGPNGSGKSTILRSVISQLKLLAGVVTLDGRDMAGMRANEIARRMAIVMTDRLRAGGMTCRDVVATGRYPYTGRLGLLSKEDERITDGAVAAVGAEAFADRPFDRVSDGQRQRVLLARAIAQEPEVIVLDEPTSFLDVRHKLELLETLRRLVRERNVAVILSMHELDLAQKIADTVVCVGNGGVDRVGPPEEIFRSGYIEGLYGLGSGRYDALSGSVEMARPEGEPRAFVICGGGSGAPVFRALQRRNVPFCAGILPENDADFFTARALAREVVAVPAYTRAGEEALGRARELIARCGRVLCPLCAFGEGNEADRLLRDEAAAAGILLPADRIPELAEGGGTDAER